MYSSSYTVTVTVICFVKMIFCAHLLKKPWLSIEFLSLDSNLNTQSVITFRREDLKRKTRIFRKINPSDCNFNQIGNQNLFLHWGIFAEDFPEEILENLHSDNSAEATVDIRRSYMYKEDVIPDSVYNDTERIGLGYKPFHLVDFHDVPDSTYTVCCMLNTNV